MTENEQRVVDTLIYCNVIPAKGTFEITERQLAEYLKVYGEIFGKNKNRKLDKQEQAFARKLAGRTLIRLNVERGATYSTIRAGMVYLISNPAFPKHYKVGMCIDVIDRLSTYQTYDPYRQFKVEKYNFVLDRRKVESLVLAHPEVLNETGEWILRDTAVEVFKKIV